MTEDTSTKAETIVVAALYKFVAWANFEALRGPLEDVCRQNGVQGTILLASEGINGTIAGSDDGIRAVIDHIKALPGCADLEWKTSIANEMPFKRMKVRLKREIVTMGVADIDPNTEVGTYVEPDDWNALISDPDIVVIDTRNDYEVALGSFEGAINPETRAFRDFPEWAARHIEPHRQKKVAMFCTGGIRCEKATALVKRLGVEEVFHLKGGILKYLEQVPEEESLWQGECFVFDERVSVGPGLKPGPYQLCSVCRRPFITGTPGGYADRFCTGCDSAAPDKKKQAALDRQRQIDLAQARGDVHIGGQSQVGNKSRKTSVPK